MAAYTLPTDLVLEVSADFLASDYAPNLCPFTGATTELRPRPIGPNRLAKEQRRQLQANGGDPDIIRGDIVVPCRAGGYFAPQLWDLAAMLALFVAFVAAAWLVLGIKGARWTDSAHIVAYVVLGDGLLGAWLAKWKFHQCVRIVLSPRPSYVLMQFPPQRKDIHEHYLAAWVSYVAAGEPGAIKIHDDEGWEDQAQAGWDQGRHDAPSDRPQGGGPKP